MSGPLISDWSYSTDTLQVDVDEDDDDMIGRASGDGSLNDGSDEEADDEAETRTITDVPIPPRSRMSGSYVAPSREGGPDSFLLTFEKDDLLNSDLCMLDGRVVYTVSTRTNGKVNSKSPGNKVVTSLYKMGTGVQEVSFTLIKRCTASSS